MQKPWREEIETQDELATRALKDSMARIEEMALARNTEANAKKNKI